VGAWLEREESSAPGSPERRSAIRSSLVLFVIGVIGFAAGMFLLSESKAPQPGTDLADLLLKHPEDYALSFGHFSTTHKPSEHSAVRCSAPRSPF